MSWSADMRCLYCDGKLPLYRKITNGQFCSTSHRKAYWQEQERLAVERLHQTHSSLVAARPVIAPEAILGPAVAPVETPLSGFVAPALVYPQAQGAPWMLAVDPLVYEMDLQPGKPLWTPHENPVRSLAAGHIIRMLQVWFGFGSVRSSRLAGAAPRGGDYVFRPVALEPVSALPMSVIGVDLEQSQAEPAPSEPPFFERLLGLAVLPEAVAPTVELKPRSALPARMPRPTLRLTLALAPVTPEIEKMPETPQELEIRAAEQLFALERFAAYVHAPQAKGDVQPAESLLAPMLAPGHRVVKTARFPGLAEAKPMARLAAVGGKAALLRSAALQPIAAQLQLNSKTQPQRVVLPQRQPGLGMGGGSRYPVQYRHQSKPGEQAGPVDFPGLGSDVFLPAAQPAPQPDPNALLDAIVPPPAGLAALEVKLGGPVTQPLRPLLLDIATIPQPLHTKHILGSSGLEPLDAKPVSDEFETGMPMPAPLFDRTGVKAHLWTQASKLWQVAPRDLKLLAFAIPALLALAFHRELPKVHVSAPSVSISTAGLRHSLHNVFDSQLTTVRQAVIERAGVALDDDFRSGLDDWGSRGDATATWSFDPTGFVRPGPLALYRPSLNLSDYELQFLGMVDKKAMSWVVRAEDFDNYYVVKLEVLKPGPRTTVGITRYAVIHGKAEDRVDTPVQIEAQPDTIYRVAMDLEGENFSLTVQGQMIDSWSEPRLMHGGVGFFTSHGEESRVRWVAIRHQYDMLGRLCAYLAPYETPTTNGSW